MGRKLWEYAKGLCTKTINNSGIQTAFSRPQHHLLIQHGLRPWPEHRLRKSSSGQFFLFH